MELILQFAMFFHCFLCSFFDFSEESNIPLAIACRNNDIEIAQMLLESHSPTSTIDGVSVPLLIATRQNNVQLVFLLIQHGVDPNYRGISPQTALEIAIEYGYTEIVRVLVASGAEIHMLNESIMPLYIKDLINDWIDEKIPFIPDPNPNADIEKSFKQINEDLQTQQTKIGGYLNEFSGYDFQSSFISPAINHQNSLLVNFAKFVKKIDTFGKVVLHRRYQLLFTQFQAIGNYEKSQLKTIFNNDEKQWAEILERTKCLIGSNSELFSNEASMGIDTLLSQLPRIETDILSVYSDGDFEIRKVNRNTLLFLNQYITLFKILITEVYRLFESFTDACNEVLNRSIDALSTFRDVILDVRQMSIDIVIDPTGENESLIENKCIQQCEKIQIDSTFLLWQKAQFQRLSANILKCLRLSLQ